MWIASGASLVTLTIMNLLILRFASMPLKHVIATLAHAKGEKTSMKLPNPNEKKVEKSGLQPVLKFIHNLGATSTIEDDALVHKNAETKIASNTLNFPEALESNAAGMVFMDKNGSLLFHNNNVPTHDTPEGAPALDLQFYNETPIDEWIQECEKSAVNAQKSWTRVASKPAGEDDRKLYDIVATYQKGSAVPVVAIFIEKTKEYRPEEDDLNFIAFAAHELRGPITVIRGYLDTLVDEFGDTITAEQKELFQRLIVSSNRLSSYINNILNSARYDQRHLNLSLSETSVLDIYDIISDDMALRATAQRRMLHVDLPANLPTVAADVGSASEVFGNLIDNAIKYSNEGGSIEVTAEAHDDFVEVTVSDHGIGMPANVVGNLFHKFYRSHRSRETVAGTGIGLYISKGIIESHGGTMEARSVEGAGSTFSFTLPIYAVIAHKLEKEGGSNKTLISNHSGSWIKNHGQIRG